MTREFGGEYARHFVPIVSLFATRENLFSLLAMAGSPKENGTIVVIFEGNFPKIKVLI